MAVECKCSKCGQRFKAADSAVGRRVKCPHCSTVLQLPGQPAPIASSTPIPPRPASQEPPEVSRVYPCPDCGQTVSRRAAQCPHCGCPLSRATAAATPVVPPPVAGTTPRSLARRRDTAGRFVRNSNTPRSRARRRTLRQIAFLSTAIALLAGMVVAGVYLTVANRDRSTRSATPAAPPVARRDRPEPAPPPPPPSPPPTEEAASSPPAPSPPAPSREEQVAQWKDQMAAAAARQVDDHNRMKHNLMSSMPQLAELARVYEQIPELANPRGNQPGKNDPARTVPDPSKPFVSRFEELRDECRAYLDEQVPDATADFARIEQAAGDWIKTQMPEVNLLDELMQPRAATP